LEKIDIVWSGPSVSRACQVKSSINQLRKSDVEKWAAELEKQSTANELVLLLIGPCSASVARIGSLGRVSIPPPRNIDFEELLGFAAHLLDRFLVQENIKAQSPHHRELMVRALVAELSIFASNGRPIDRHGFMRFPPKFGPLVKVESASLNR
jgi:hypothetical protein